MRTTTFARSVSNRPRVAITAGGAIPMPRRSASTTARSARTGAPSSEFSVARRCSSAALGCSSTICATTGPRRRFRTRVEARARTSSLRRSFSEMTIRTRLGLGFLAVAVILVLPLVVALRALERLQDETIALRDNEFAASLLLGRMRSDTDELRQAETALLLFPSDSTHRRISTAIDALALLTDSLDHYQLDSAALNVRSAMLEVRQHLPVEYADALARRTVEAGRTSEERMLPAITRIERTLVQAERSLRQRTIGRVQETADAGGAARRLSAVSLVLAALLAGAIAVGLTRSVSHPVRDLERGMAAVANGDFEHRLSIGASGGNEFGRLAQSFETMSRQLAVLVKLKAELV